ncbi:SNARE domain-containing protein [Cryptosporidium ubiquitum]|uniref:SNARE domain-containing protein n=1 Tax=Cryptosporidium ubiquitum TaxID=857276 RepID=A0A1J4MM49_9CRYT|nr:SNARE domain-containing protein [Cryptosporidium ubiquitum]OII75346.1 SNARE domain-containing protein [Cryptosporidium ubiquitum]
MTVENIYNEESRNSPEQEIAELQSECKKALKNTLRIAADANEISLHSATKLNEQTEQLYKIEDETEKIKDNLDKTERAINSLKNPFLFWFKGLFRQNESKSIKPAPISNFQKDKNTHNKETCHVISDFPKERKLYCKDLDDRHEFNNEIDEGLEQIGDMLKEMHNRAISMNTALKNQGGILNNIDANIYSNNSRMKDQRTELGKFIRK